jgi:hypothetical protein
MAEQVKPTQHSKTASCGIIAVSLSSVAYI